MYKREAISSEADFYNRDRRRDPGISRYKSIEKTIAELEAESEEKLKIQIESMNNYYNNNEFKDEKQDSHFTDFMIKFLKTSLLSKEDLFLFERLKKKKRRQSMSLITDLSSKQIIDGVIFSEKKSLKTPRTRSTADDDLLSHEITIQYNYTNKTQQSQSQQYNNDYYDLNEIITQNINPSTKIRLMLVTNENDDLLMERFDYFFKDIELFTDAKCLFDIQHRFIQLNNHKTISLSLYNTKMGFHNDSTCQGNDYISLYNYYIAYYEHVDTCIYFLDESREMTESLKELKIIEGRIRKSSRNIKLIVVSFVDLSINSIEMIKEVSDCIIVYCVNNSNDFIQLAVRKLLLNIIIRRPMILKKKLSEINIDNNLINEDNDDKENDDDGYSDDDDEDDLRFYDDGLKCTSSYEIEIPEDTIPELYKLGRSKSINYAY